MATELDVANSGAYTPQSLLLRRRLAEAMMKAGMETGPIASPWQGVARMVQAMMGGMEAKSLEDKEDAMRKAEGEATRSMYGLGARSAPSSSTGQPAKAASAASADAGNLDKSQPRSVRTNNPGAIEYGPYAISQGATGSDGRYAIFPSREAGYKAQENLLKSYIARGFDTPEKIVTRWAPPDVDNNSTGPYIASVAAKLGIKPGERVPPERIGELAEAMAGYEAGTAVPRAAGAQAAVRVADASGAVPASIPGVTVDFPPTAPAGAQAAAAAVPLATPAPATAPGSTPAPAQTGRLSEAQIRQLAIQNVGPEVVRNIGHSNPQIAAKAQALFDAEVARIRTESGPLDPLKQATLTKTQLEAQGEQLKNTQAQRDLEKSSPESIGTRAKALLESLAQVPQEYGRQATETAIGPLSGANLDDSRSTVSAIFGAIPEAMAKLRGASIAAYQGGANPTEVRQRIEGDTQALVSLLKPYLRVKGEGSQSNYELIQLQKVIASAATASTVEEYNRRIEDARHRIKDLTGIEIGELAPQQRSGAGPKYAEEETKALEGKVEAMEPGVGRTLTDFLLKGIYGITPERSKEPSPEEKAAAERAQIIEELKKRGMQPGAIDALLNSIRAGG